MAFIFAVLLTGDLGLCVAERLQGGHGFGDGVIADLCLPFSMVTSSSRIRRRDFVL